MNDLFEKGFARKVPNEQCDKRSNATWYLPHHPVLHPQKPDKVRVVFECAAEYRGTSLNKELLQGSDLTNNLVGVLTQFWKGPVAMMADVEAGSTRFEFDYLIAIPYAFCGGQITISAKSQ